jgi:DNA-directed RNA polymerase specialized sigma24 family protein
MLDSAAVLEYLQERRKPRRYFSARHLASVLQVNIDDVNQSLWSLYNEEKIILGIRVGQLFARATSPVAPLTEEQRNRLEQYTPDAYYLIQQYNIPSYMQDAATDYIHRTLILAIRTIPDNCRSERGWVFGKLHHHFRININRHYRSLQIPHETSFSMDLFTLNKTNTIDHQDEIEYLTKTISPIEKQMLYEHYGMGKFFRELGKQPTTTIRRKVAKALNKVREQVK